MDSREIIVSFTLSKEEAQRETEVIAKQAGAGKAAIWLFGLSAILWLAIGGIELATNHGNGKGWFDLALGGFYAAIVIAQRVKVRKVSPCDTLVRFSEAGVFFERPTVREFSWNAVRSMRRSDTAYYLNLDPAMSKAPLDRVVVLPVSALGENRTDLWELAERMMVGPLRPVSAQVSLDRSGALRRNDAGSIVNRQKVIA
jgi:hypothetical protein